MSVIQLQSLTLASEQLWSWNPPSQDPGYTYAYIAFLSKDDGDTVVTKYFMPSAGRDEDVDGSMTWEI